MMLIHNLSPDAIHVLDMSSILLAMMTLYDILPAATIALTFLWTCIRIYETDTIQNLIYGKRTDDDKSD
jgi:hypothetical protein